MRERGTRPADGEALDSVAIVTTEANVAMRPLHDRMPVILAPGDYWAWLNGATAANQVQAQSDAVLAAYPVGKAVDNVRNAGARLIQPV